MFHALRQVEHLHLPADFVWDDPVDWTHDHPLWRQSEAEVNRIHWKLRGISSCVPADSAVPTPAISKHDQGTQTEKSNLEDELCVPADSEVTTPAISKHDQGTQTEKSVLEDELCYLTHETYRLREALRSRGASTTLLFDLQQRKR